MKKSNFINVSNVKSLAKEKDVTISKNVIDEKIKGLNSYADCVVSNSVKVLNHQNKISPKSRQSRTLGEEQIKAVINSKVCDRIVDFCDPCPTRK